MTPVPRSSEKLRKGYFNVPCDAQSRPISICVPFDCKTKRERTRWRLTISRTGTSSKSHKLRSRVSSLSLSFTSFSFSLTVMLAESRVGTRVAPCVCNVRSRLRRLARIPRPRTRKQHASGLTYIYTLGRLTWATYTNLGA